MTSLRRTIKRLSDRNMLPTGAEVGVTALIHRFRPAGDGSLRALLSELNTQADRARPTGGGIAPYYRRTGMETRPDIATQPAGNGSIDLSKVHLDPFGKNSTVEEAVLRFDRRAAAAVHADFSAQGPLVETLEYPNAPAVTQVKARCLSLLALADYFEVPDPRAMLTQVSDAIVSATPGWCGTFGPGVDSLTDLIDLEKEVGEFVGGLAGIDIELDSAVTEGNYDMVQMHLLQMAYRYYDRLTEQAREHLIGSLLAQGRVHRPGVDDHLTNGPVPNDYSRAGVVTPGGAKIRIGETENHILMIQTARYLTNQLLYQREQNPVYDNRRNGLEDSPSCIALLLSLLRNILVDDFSEYNAKNYQTHTRYALLNLQSYAYDHEVRLAARMVLDYVSALMAVSSNDLRRMAPFRRLNENAHVARDSRGFMTTSLIDATGGADPSCQHFAMLAGNTRIYERQSWLIKTDEKNGNDAVMYALSDYRLPRSIHDLFLSDSHRRYFQRLHRVRQEDVELTGRTADNQEIYAGSPSYLITAGGAFAPWAIDPGPVSLSKKLRTKNDQQLGVALPSSFIPTSRTDCGDLTQASDLIQFGRFSDVAGVYNYGVAPDFVCGYQCNMPAWVETAIARDSDPVFGKFEFVNCGSGGSGRASGDPTASGADSGPGFYLAFLRTGDLTIMEAFDTWLHPSLSFEQFRLNVFMANKELMERGIELNVVTSYRTQNDARVMFKIWNEGAEAGATVGVDLSNSRDARIDSFGDAANEFPVRLVGGTVLNSRAEGVIEISNHFLGTTLRLDLSDAWRPRRTDEDGVLEEAGNQHEVWVNFGWTGPEEGDFFHPFSTLAAAVAAVQDGGVIKVMPGWTSERPALHRGKRFRIVAPLGDVKIGVN